MGFWDGSGISWTNNLHLTPDRQPHQHLITHFLQAGCSSWRPTNSVKALMACRQSLVDLNNCCWSVRHGIGWNQLSHDIMLNWLLQSNGSQRPHHSCHLANADNAEIYCRQVWACKYMTPNMAPVVCPSRGWGYLRPSHGNLCTQFMPMTNRQFNHAAMVRNNAIIFYA